MTYLDAAIIYLACGAPLSMHYFFGQRGKPTVNFIARALFVALVWPVGVIRLFVIGSRNSSNGAGILQSNKSDTRLDRIRRQIEMLAFKNENAAPVFEFREVFARYIGLTQAMEPSRTEVDTSELFRLSGHPNGSLATRCVARNAALRLLSHAERSRSEFVDLIGSMPLLENPDVTYLAIEAADLIGDHWTVGRLTDLSGIAEREEMNNGPNFTLGARERSHVTQS